MRARRFAFALLILTCGFLAGVVLMGRMRAATTEAATAAPQTAAARPPVQAQLPIPSGLPDFSGIAARTVPAVANISSTQVIARQFR
jgi:S1-C subfamily serine protease